MFSRRRRALPRCSGRLRDYRLAIERLEDRLAPAAVVTIQSASLVDAHGNAITAPATGEEVFIQASWTTTGLALSDHYTVGFTVDGVTVPSGLIAGQPGAGVPVSTFVGGWFAAPGTHSATVVVDPAHALAGADESQTMLAFSFAPQAPTTLPARLLDPMGVQQSQWTIAHYVDVNPPPAGPGDYNGGPFTTAGSTGMDFTLGDFAQMDAGYPVYAALGGTVISMQDGQFDRNSGTTGGAGNFVLINNGNGWQTLYSGFAANTISVTQNQAVAPGQLLGLVGGSGSGPNPGLHFEVHHNGSIVETNDDPADYWASPLPYEGNVPAYVLASGITGSDPAADLAERPVDVNQFPAAGGAQIWYWYRLSHLNPTDQVTVNWIGPTAGTGVAFNYTPSGTENDQFYEWQLPNSFWIGHNGLWQAALNVNGVVVDHVSFNVVLGSAAPALRVTQASAGGALILDNRTTPIDFGAVAQTSAAPVQTFSLSNPGQANLVLAGLVLPPDFSVVGGLPARVGAGQTATLTVQMNTGFVGAQFGQLSFTTNVPGESTFAFNLKGLVGGTAAPSAPTITPSSAASVYNPRFGPVAVDPQVILTDGFPSSFAGGALTVELASGAAPADHLAISNQGVGPLQIGTSGSTVLYGGTPIGSFTGGDSGSPLVISFTAASTLAAAQALARDVVFRSDAPAPLEPRYVRFTLVDGVGAKSNLAIKTMIDDPDLLSPNTQVNLALNPTTVVYGDSPTLTATVINLAGAGVPTGNVSFLAGGFPLGTVALTNGRAALTIGGLGAGPDTITAFYAGDAINSQGAATLSLVVLKAHLTVTADNKSKYEGTPNPDLTATITGFVGADTATVVTGSPALATAATTSSIVGIYPISVAVGTLSAANYDFPSLVPGSLVVNSPGPASVTTVASSASPVYGQALSFSTTVAPIVSNAATPTGSVQFQINGLDFGLPVDLIAGKATSQTVPVLGAGTYTVTTFYSGDSIYPAGSGVLILAVAKAPLIVAAASLTAVYGGPIPTLSATISGFVAGDTSSVVTGAPTLSTAATASSQAGVYTINVGAGTLAAANYSFTNLESGLLTISKATLTVTANNATTAYGSPLPGFSVTITGFRNGDSTNAVSGSAALSTPATAGSPVGTYPIHAAQGTLAASNYSFSRFVDGTLTVIKAHLTVTASNASTTYGSAIPPLGATFSGFLDGDGPSVVSGAAGVATAATPASPVGLYLITVTAGTLAAANYDFTTFRNATLTIAKAHLTVTATPTAMSYGSPIPSLNTMINGLVNNDTPGVVTGHPNLSTTATSFSPVGAYPIAIAAGTLTATNYDFPNLVAGTLTVNKAHLTLTASPASSTYGAQIPPLGATISGYVNGDGPSVVSGSPLVSTSATPSSAVGSYAITVAAGTLTAANYDFANLVPATLTVTKAHLTVTADDKAMYQGAPVPTLSVTLTGFVNGDTVAVVSGAPALSTPGTQFSPLGSYPINVAAGTLSAHDYDFPTLVAGTLTVGPPGDTAVSVAASDPAPAYGEALTFTAMASALSSGAPTPTGTFRFLVAGASIGLPVAISGGAATSPLIAPLPAGIYTITASYSGDGVYSGNTGTLTLTVAKAHLTVSAQPATSIYGAPIPPLGATVSGFINGDTPAVVSGSAQVTTTATPDSGAGVYLINVAPGTLSAPNYDFTNLVGSTLVMTRAPLSVTADFQAKVAGTPNPPLTATISGFVGTDTPAVVSGGPALSTSATTSSPPGLYPIAVSVGTLAAANYDFTTFQSGNLDVIPPGGAALSVIANNPAPIYGQAVTFSAAVIAAGGQSAAPTGSIQFQVDGANLGGAVTLTASSAVSPPAALLGAGTHSITALYSGDANFPANVATTSITVARAHLSVVASGIFTTYGSAIPTLSAVLSGFVAGDNQGVVSGAPSLSTTATPTSGAGLYPITVGAGTLAAANYDFPDLVAGTLTVSKAHLTVIASPATSTYGSPIPALSATFSGLIAGDSPTVVSGAPGLSTTATPASPVGAYPITAGPGTLSAANYDFPSFVGSTLTVAKAPVTVAANPASSTYGGPLPALGVTISGLVNGDPPTVISGAPIVGTSASGSSPAGTYPITVMPGTMAAANYDFPSFVAGTLTINKAPLTVTAGAASSTYGSPLPSFQATLSGFVLGDTPAVVRGSPAFSTPALPTSPAGVYPITVDVGTLSAANYDFTNFVPANLTVAKAHLSVHADAVSSPYGSPLPVLTATFSGLVAGDTPGVVSGAPALSTTATQSSGVGVYPITIGLGTLSSASYDFSSFTASTFTVTPAHLTVAADDASSTYGNPIPALSATITGLVGGDTLAAISGKAVLSTTASPFGDAGAYPITVSLGTLAATNYDFPTLVAGTLTVARAPLTVTASAATSVYGESIPAFAATYSGFLGSDGPGLVSGSPSLTTPATPFSGAGVYPITVGPGTLAAANYDFPDLVGSSLTVTPAHLAVIASDASSTYGSPLPALAATFSGFLGSDTAAVVTGSALLSTTATASSVAGSYPIAVSQGTLAAANYDFTSFTGGTLTITPATATLSLGGLVFPYDGLPRSTTATTSPAGLSGVTITYASDSGNAPTAVGSYTVTATLENPDYTAAPVTGTLMIQPATASITWANPVDVPIGTALGPQQLDATASVPGSFSYAPAAGTVLNSAGASLLSARFTPEDSADYLPVTAQVTVNVTTAPVVQFSAAVFNADAVAASATIVLVRSGATSSAVTVNLATAGGSATPGAQYTPVSTPVTFNPGQTTTSFAIALHDTGASGGTVSVGLILSAAGGTAVIGSQSVATLVIQQSDPSPTPTPTSSATVQSVQVERIKIGKRKTSQAIVVQYSGALNPGAAGNVASYRLVSAGKDRQFGTRDDRPVRLAAATYSATAHTVTLLPRKPLVLSPPLQLQISGAALTGPAGSFTAILGKRGTTAAGIGR
jgi:hypothetical protein